MAVIQANRHHHSLYQLCRCLGVSRHYFYYQRKNKQKKTTLRYAQEILTLFKKNYQAYGTRRLREALRKEGIRLSRRYIGFVMKALSLVSKYTVKRYKAHATEPNSSTVTNVLQREFCVGGKLTVIVADLTYVRVAGCWHYICLLVNISDRVIAGYRVGKHKTATLVMSALRQIAKPLSSLALFHSDRGKEFDNTLLDSCFDTFSITRLLSRKGCPYDNAVAEATFKTINTEFVKGERFDSIEQLRQQFAVYVYWYNYDRLHSSLGYLSPREFNQQASLNLVV